MCKPLRITTQPSRDHSPCFRVITVRRQPYAKATGGVPTTTRRPWCGNAARAQLTIVMSGAMPPPQRTGGPAGHNQNQENVVAALAGIGLSREKNRCMGYRQQHSQNTLRNRTPRRQERSGVVRAQTMTARPLASVRGAWARYRGAGGAQVKTNPGTRILSNGFLTTEPPENECGFEADSHPEGDAGHTTTDRGARKSGAEADLG